MTTKFIPDITPKGGVAVRWLIIVLIAIAMNLIYLSGAIQYGATDENFFDKTFEKIDAKAAVGLNDQDFEAVKQKLIDYVGLKTKTFAVPVTIDGQRVDFFNARERAHMVDVQNLFVLNDRILKAAAIAVILLYVLGRFVLGQRRILATGLACSGPLMLIFAGVVGVLISQDFTGIFIKFHETFFTNDLWLLDPATDRMIVLLQEQFFNDMAIHIGWIAVVVAVLSTTVGIVARYNYKQTK